MAEINSRLTVPMRVDFAGGWLDVPSLAIEGAYVVNCAITPFFDEIPWHKGGGVGGSAAAAIFAGRNAESEELMRAGWQDAAVIRETGLCVWRSGPRPVLDAKLNPDWLHGKMALMWMGKEHKTMDFVTTPRNYLGICAEGKIARMAVLAQNLDQLGRAILGSYHIQLDEGMDCLPEAPCSLAMKYCGSGHGGYALYLFQNFPQRQDFLNSTPGTVLAVEPYMR